MIRLNLAVLDEAIFAGPGVLDFRMELIPVNGVSRLRITLDCDPVRFPDISDGVRTALARIPVVREGALEGLLDIDTVRLSLAKWFTSGAAKRTLINHRQQRPMP